MDSSSEAASRSSHAQAEESGRTAGFVAGATRFVWGDPPKYKDGNVAQIERALGVIRGFSVLGLIPVMIYGALAAYCDANCAHSAATSVVRGLSIALLAAVAAFSAGGMLGFLFGLPRWGDAPAVPQGARRKDDQPETTPSQGKSAGNPAQESRPDAEQQKQAEKRDEKPGAADPGIGGRASRVRPNTGLEKVMDWLTTLIVGLGLVHIRTAMDQAREISGWVTTAISAGAPATQTNFTGGGAILLPYTIAGFLLVYLWTQRYMGREMLLADIESNTIEQQVKEVKEEMRKENKIALTKVADMAEQVLNRPEAVSATGVVALSREDLSRQGNAAAEAFEGVDPATVADIRNRYANAKEWNDEPMSGFGVEEADGRRIEATVARASRGLPFFNVTISVRSTNSNAPLSNPVIFLLHHTFPTPVRRVPPREGSATISVLCSGSFIVGALVVGQATKLALDLSKLPDVPQDFREN